MVISRRRFLASALGIGAAALTAGGATLLRERGLHRVERSGHALGTTVRLTVLHGDTAAAHQAIDGAFTLLDCIEDSLSLYRPESKLSRLNRNGRVDSVAWDGDLKKCIWEGARMSWLTGGAFDITVQPLWKLYADAQRAGRLPTPQEIEEARRFVGYHQILVDFNRISFSAPGVAVTLNGIAQGHAVDRVRDYLSQAGIEHALIDVGELAALGDKQGEPWKAGIQHPRVDDAYAAVTKLDDRCLATSGDYATAFSADRGANHIIDARTGLSPSEFSSVSVLAKRGIDADAPSTAIFIVGFKHGLNLLQDKVRADAFFVFKDGRTFATKGFPQV